MKINEISSLNYVANVKKLNKVDAVSKEKRSDKVELSKEAKALSKSTKNLTPERIKEINRRINDKFYDKEEVLNVVAEQILKSQNLQNIRQSNHLNKNI